MLKLSDFITAEELKALCQTSDLVGWYRVFINYALIWIAFCAVIFIPGWISFLVSSWIIGGRILGMAILSHDAGHDTLFRSHSLNAWVGRWLLGAFVLVDYNAFKKGHAKHHQFAGTPNDPDKIFVQNYPATTASMIRKIFRDISGLNGLREIMYQLKVSTWQKRLPALLVHAFIISCLLLADAIWAYSVFWTGYIFVYPLLSRLRIMGEHGAVADLNSRDPRLNTRTTQTGLLSRLLIAPNEVNYHLEHHINQKIPAHKLAQAHQLFKQRGMYEGFDCIEANYWQVLKKCISDTRGKSRSSQHAPSSVSHLS